MRCIVPPASVLGIVSSRSIAYRCADIVFTSIMINFEVSYSDGQARFSPRIRWLMQVLLFSLDTMVALVQIPNPISAHSRLSTSPAFTWLNTAYVVVCFRSWTQ
jgi:hypothetical protein